MVAPLRAGPRRPGLTLMELVVVLVIVAALAALVIPKLGFLQTQAGNAAGAAGAADLTNNLELYKITTSFYPNQFDSLLDGSGAVISGIMFQHPGGQPPFPLTAGTLPATANFGFLESFGHAFGPGTGSYAVMDHDTTATDPSSSGTIQRIINYDGNDKVTTVDQVNGLSLWTAAGYNASSLPGTTGATTSDVMLVAFGVGQNNTAVGSTMTSPPRQTTQQPTLYARYIGIFAVYNSGKAAELKLVVDSYLQPIESNIKSYQKAAPQPATVSPTTAPSTP